MSNNSEVASPEALRRQQRAERASRAATMAAVLRGFLPLPRDEKLSREIEESIDGYLLVQAEQAASAGSVAGRLGEGNALAVIGESGTGKTRSMHRAFSRQPEFLDPENGGGSSLLVSVVAPSPCTVRQLGKTLLAGVGYRTERDLKENVVWEMVRRHLRLRGVRFIHIDEVQHVFQSRNPAEIQKVRDTLKSLMQTPDWPVWLFLSGLPSIADFIEGDVQIRRRTRFIRFLPLSLAKDRPLVDEILRLYPKRAKISLARPVDDDFRLRLLHASLHETGLLIELVQDAVRAALRDPGDGLKREHFAVAYERRTGCDEHENVFLASNWELLEVHRSVPAVEEVPEETALAQPPKVPRNR